MIVNIVNDTEIDLTYGRFGYTIPGAANAVSETFGIPERKVRDAILDGVIANRLKIRDQDGFPPINSGPITTRDARITIEDLNEYFRAQCIPYQLPVPTIAVTSAPTGERQDNGLSERDTTFESASEGAARRKSDQFALPGVPTAEIIEGFKLEPAKSWREKLRHIDREAKAYKSALVQRGARGKRPHTWNPALFALALINTGDRKYLSSLRVVINSQFSDWLPEFDTLVAEKGGFGVHSMGDYLPKTRVNTINK